MLEISNLSFSYGDVKVIEHLDFALKKGEFVLISGANGSGKSTLFKLILNEFETYSGKINFSKDAMIGYVPQLQTTQGITFPISVEEFVVYALYREFGLVKLPRKRHYLKAREVMAKLELLPYKDKALKELSGGLKQRAYIARAMVTSPNFYLFDEPTVGIDEMSKRKFFDILKDLKKDEASILMISHEVEELLTSCPIDSHYEMKGGKMIRC